MVTDFARIHAFTDRFYVAGTLVPEHDGKCALWVFAGECVCIWKLVSVLLAPGGPQRSDGPVWQTPV